jgi:biotin-[acetyl-CoA-carboxylase] ligase BirA-like protein
MPSSYQTIQLETIDSTSRYLKDYVIDNRPTTAVFCTTKIQTNGYGQQKRSWITNQDSAIFSLAYPIAPKSIVPGLVSLQLAALLHQSITELTEDTLYLKWPNDLFNQHGKIAGMLIEPVIEQDYKALVIGIGINRSAKNLLDGASHTHHFNNEELFNKLYTKILQAGLLEFSTSELMKYWQMHDYFAYNESVNLISENNQQIGIYKGINQNAQAMIEIDKQNIALSSGQTSIRKIKQNA